MNKFGKKQDIPKDIQKLMIGKSMPDYAKIRFQELSYLTIPHYNFMMEISTGNIVIARDLANEVLEIFRELFDINYPIESMVLIDYLSNDVSQKLNTLDKVSMAYNNSSGFCYRKVDGEERLSNHSFGRALDLNPKINPYITINGVVTPDSGAKFAIREKIFSEIENSAMILPGNDVYKIFKKYGWSWGGELWTDRCFDYHHFQKNTET